MAKKKTAKKKPGRKKGGPSKSQAVRDQIAKNPNASANDIAAAASKVVGEKVTAALVYNIKSTDGVAKKRGRPKKKGAKGGRPAGSSSSGANFDLIKEAAALLNHAGDAKAAKDALDAAAEISKALGK